MSNDRRELMRLIDDWRDQHGQPSEASIARAIDVAPQTISSWRKRGIKEPPALDTLHRMADYMSLPRDYVGSVVAYDIHLVDVMPEPVGWRRDEGRRSG